MAKGKANQHQQTEEALYPCNWPSIHNPVERDGIEHNGRFYTVSDCRQAYAAREAWIEGYPDVVAFFDAEMAVLHERYLMEYKAITGVEYVG